eukprot:scaffold1459_cov260-Pinguiococcus_pyrenoidosus.AAC.25
MHTNNLRADDAFSHLQDGADEDSDECAGPACFRSTFIITATAAIVAAATGSLMHIAASRSRAPEL